jgi:hypothetical protein
MAKKGVATKLYNLPPGKFAKSWKDGRISTTVYCNFRPWGELEFKVTQNRALPDHYDKERSEVFHEDDLQDAMRGLYRSQRWIKKRRRRLLWRGYLWWLP